MVRSISALLLTGDLTSIIIRFDQSVPSSSNHRLFLVNSALIWSYDYGIHGAFAVHFWSATSHAKLSNRDLISLEQVKFIPQLGCDGSSNDLACPGGP